MRKTIIFSPKLITKIIVDNVCRCTLIRHASTGLQLWEQDINIEIKHKIENYWKDKVNRISCNDSSREKFYVLSMFPYPSGALHMGHVRVYSISDSIARFARMKGKYVIHPIGWDAFGLPAENAAIEKDIDPAEWTKQNIENMREQLNTLGCSFDWDRELSTCDPKYYKWTQELFLKLFDRGLIYQKEAFVNWDPVDQTVLADEQVDSNNRSWRSGAKVEKKLLNQWFIKTTKFAKPLLDGLSNPMLRNWRDIIKLQQHWIGDCNGTNFEFNVLSNVPGYPKTLSLWTDKPERIEHAKFVAISTRSILNQIEDSEGLGTEKRLSATILNPFTGEKLPMFSTNKIKFTRFRDNHLGIPCESEDDASFCNNMGIRFEAAKELSPEERQQKISKILNTAKQLNIGGYPVSFKLRDWLISRQRYWGTPIPIIHCENCGVQPVPRKDLPVELPKMSNTIRKSSSLAEVTDWVKTQCPKCGKSAKREVDTMDTFVDSSWYFMRYIDSNNDKEIFAKDKASQMLPVDLYIGGKEHAVLHLYYARFMNHFLHSEGLLPTSEPFKQLLVQGMVMGMSHRTNDSGKYLKPDEVEKVGKVYVEKSTGNAVISSWEKMSKSKYNGVDPSEMFENYGTDTTRLLILADVAPTSHRNWSTATFPGILGWQHRLWITVRQFLKSRNELTNEIIAKTPSKKFIEENAYMFDSRNFYVKGVTFNIVDSQQLSVGISKMQGLTNSIRKASSECIAKSREFERALAAQIIMLAPLAPHFASELWAGFCSAPHRLVNDGEIQWDKDVLEQSWPEVDMDYKLKVTVYVNNGEISKIKILRKTLDNISAEELASLVTNHETVAPRIGKRIISEIIVHVEKGCDGSCYIKTMKNLENNLNQGYSVKVQSR